MSIKLEDGLGTGRQAGVNLYNRLETHIVEQSALSFASKSGNAFVYRMSKEIQLDNTEEIFSYETNNSGGTHYFSSGAHWVLLNPEDGYVVRLNVYIEPRRISGGVELTALNMYRSSGKTAETLIYGNTTNDMIVNYSADHLGLTLIMSAKCPVVGIQTGGAFILGPRDTSLTTVTGPAGAIISGTAFHVEEPLGRVI